MSIYNVHTIETAPEGSKPLLQNLRSAIGMIPNLAAAMSESPELLKGFGIAVSILPNFAHYLTQCPIDEPFRAHEWTPTDVDASSALIG